MPQADGFIQLVIPLTLLVTQPRWFTQVHNFAKRRWIDIHVVNVPEGPRHAEVWTSTIIIRDVRTDALVQCAGSMHSATGATKRSAQDAASYLALVALGVTQ
ncbi:hypothetical protein FRB95_011092 [Tulasnella sp. JGI-2019a]|nr:hypothetical protein FRB95_011092 [Tulasnella sp. JGI-2019a]